MAAVTADQVVVELQAKTEAYNQRIAQASANFDKHLNSMSSAAISAGNASAVAFNSATGAFEKAAPAIKKTGDASKMAQQQVRNLAFQFQDIGTMLAAGQSPFMLLAQQLPQVTMYGGQMTGVMGALKQTVSSLISPLGIATTAFVLLGTAAVSYFDELFTGGTKSEEQLKKEAQLIQEVVDKWGDALPALKEYNEERLKAENNKKLEDATAIAIAKQWEDLRGQIGGFTVEYADLMAQLQGAGAPVEEIERFRRAFFDLKANVEDGKATQKDYQAVTEALSSLLNSTSIPAVSEFAATIASLVGPLNAAARATAEFNKQANMQTGKAPFEDYAANLIKGFGELEKRNTKFTAEQSKRNSMSKEQLDIENEIARVKAEAGKAGAIFSEQELRNQAEQNIAADNRRSAEEKARRKAEADSRRAGRKTESQAERDARAYDALVKSAQDRIDKLQLEEQLVGKTGVAAEIMRMKLELLQKAQDKGRTVSEEQRKQIDALADAYGKAADKLAAMTLAEELRFERDQMFRSPTEQRVSSTLRSAGIDPESDYGAMISGQIRLNEKLAEAKDLTMDFAQSFTQDLLNGVSAMDALGKAAGRLGEQLLNIALNQLINSLFKNLGGVFGGLGAASSDPWSGLRGFSGGGYTGSGGRTEPAGVVHKGEVVWSQDDVRNAGGVGVVEAMRRGSRGYSVGGPVAMPMNSPTTPVSQPSRSSSEGTPYVAGVRVFMDDQMNIRAEMVGIARRESASSVKAYDKSGPMRFARDSKQANRRGLVR